MRFIPQNKSWKTENIEICWTNIPERHIHCIFKFLCELQTKLVYEMKAINNTCVGVSLWIQSPENLGGTNLSPGSSLMMVPDVGMSGICLLGSWQSPPPGHLVSLTPHQSTSRRSHQSPRYLKQNLRGCQDHSQDLISAKWGNRWVMLVVSGNKENNFHPPTSVEFLCSLGILFPLIVFYVSYYIASSSRPE